MNISWVFSLSIVALHIGVLSISSLFSFHQKITNTSNIFGTANCTVVGSANCPNIGPGCDGTTCVYSNAAKDFLCPQFTSGEYSQETTFSQAQQTTDPGKSGKKDLASITCSKTYTCDGCEADDPDDTPVCSKDIQAILVPPVTRIPTEPDGDDCPDDGP